MKSEVACTRACLFAPEDCSQDGQDELLISTIGADSFASRSTYTLLSQERTHGTETNDIRQESQTVGSWRQACCTTQGTIGFGASSSHDACMSQLTLFTKRAACCVQGHTGVVACSCHPVCGGLHPRRGRRLRLPSGSPIPGSRDRVPQMHPRRRASNQYSLDSRPQARRNRSNQGHLHSPQLLQFPSSAKHFLWKSSCSNGVCSCSIKKSAPDSSTTTETITVNRNLPLWSYPSLHHAEHTLQMYHEVAGPGDSGDHK